jgi:hypothetical protein
MQVLLRKGYYAGGPVPAGLTTVPTDDGHKVLDRCSTHGDVVAEIWSQVTTGASLLDVASYLNHHQVPGGRGGPWGADRTRNLLLNERMIGLLVSEQTFEETKGILTSRASPFRKDGRKDYIQSKVEHPLPLRGLVRCALCGSPMVAQRARGGNGTKYPYLACSGRIKKGASFCSAPNLNHDSIEPRVRNALRDMVDNDLEQAFAEQHAQQLVQQDSLKEKRKESQMRCDKARAGLNRLVSLAESSDKPMAALTSRMEELQTEIDQHQHEVVKLDHEISIAGLDKEQISAAVQNIRMALAHLDELDPKEKSAVLSGFITEIRMARGVDELAVSFELSQTIFQQTSLKKEQPPAKTDGCSHLIGNGVLDRI